MTVFRVILVVLSLSGYFCHSIRKRDEGSQFFQPVFDELKEKLVKSGGNQIHIPDFSKKLQTPTIAVTFSATDGTLGNVTTLRILDLSTTAASESVTFNALLKMDVLEVLYRHFTAETGFATVTGELRATANKNAIEIQVSVFFENETCKQVLDFVRVKEFDDLNITVSNISGPFNKILVKKIFESVLNRYKPDFKSIAQAKLTDKISTALQNHNFCEYLV